MSKINKHVERQVRIELLRARAAVERQELCYHTRRISACIQPENIFALLKSKFFGGVNASVGTSKLGSWLDFALSSSQRYPLLLSGASALVSTVFGKKKWRLGALALTAWRLFGTYQTMQQNKKGRLVQAKQPQSNRIIGP